MDTISRHLTIRGRVQGVGYRRYVARAARELDVTGWVRNCADGSVEAVIAGSPEAIRTMLDRARQGPPQAMVTELTVTEIHASFERFETRATET